MWHGLSDVVSDMYLSKKVDQVFLNFHIFKHFFIFVLPPAPLLELAEDKDVRQLLEVGRQIFTNGNITVSFFL